MMKKNILQIALFPLLSACLATSPSEKLAKQIQEDQNLHVVDSMARSLIKNGFNAGSGYSQIWARDLNTFIELACEESDVKDLRGAILMFFAMQQPNNEMVDGYVLKEDFTWYDSEPYYSEAAPGHVGFKNTVETDQETSLIQLIYKYISKTGDRSILNEEIDGKTVMQRINLMIDYLMTERYNQEHGLLYGAMTADWGDVQPGKGFACDMNEYSSPAIDVYDNAMFIIALDNLLELSTNELEITKYQNLRRSIAHNTRKHLWDEKNNKFIPHIYLGASPIPDGFDENKIHYHGGTATAIEAGLLSKQEIAIVIEQMIENVKLAGAPSIGLTLYPAYPQDFFSGDMGNAYVYQNGGDWTWFGGRMIQQMVLNGFVEEAYQEITPMLNRVVKNGDFYEWYTMDGIPSGSAHFKGSAGVLAKAIELLNHWVSENKEL